MSISPWQRNDLRLPPPPDEFHWGKMEGGGVKKKGNERKGETGREKGKSKRKKTEKRGEKRNERKIEEKEERRKAKGEEKKGRDN